MPDGVCTTPQQTGCTAPAADDYLDSILALKLSDGTIAWADHTLSTDLWTLPQPVGPDFDFGAGPNLFTTTSPATGRAEQLLGAGAEERRVLGGRPRYRQGRLADHNRPDGRRDQRRHRVRHGHRRAAHLRGRG